MRLCAALIFSVSLSYTKAQSIAMGDTVFPLFEMGMNKVLN